MHAIILNMSSPIQTYFSLDNYRFNTEGRVSKEIIPRLSKHKHTFVTLQDEKYGSGNWRFAWKYGAQYLNFLEACQVYEAGFEKHFEQNPDKLKYLSDNASNVYDTNMSNIQSGKDYTHQEDSSTHLQDISIRRIMAKLNMPFNGNKPIQIRSTSEDAIGKTLTPLKVPFHEPEKVLTDKEIPTIEDFWQCNRVIQFIDQAIKQ